MNQRKLLFLKIADGALIFTVSMIMLAAKIALMKTLYQMHNIFYMPGILRQLYGEAAGEFVTMWKCKAQDYSSTERIALISWDLYSISIYRGFKHLTVHQKASASSKFII